jgi:hypothetical protein
MMSALRECSEHHPTDLECDDVDGTLAGTEPGILMMSGNGPEAPVRREMDAMLPA